MKKIFSLLFIFVIAFLVVGCGDKPDPTPNSSNAHIGTEWFRKSEEILAEQQQAAIIKNQQLSQNIEANQNPIIQ